jgi:hypothetical protein
MTRQGTVIRHTLLDSDTYAAMPDNVRSVFLCLILASDDWGRLPDNPLKLARMISVCCKLPDEVAICIEWLIRDGCMTRYQVEGESFLCWTKWEKHQERLKSRDKALYPAPSGEIEASSNPLAMAKQSPHGAPHGIPDDTPPGPPKGKERKGKERKGNSFSPELVEFVAEVFPPDKYHWTDVQRDKQVDALDKLIRLDGFPQDRVFAVMRWMRGDTEARNGFPGWSAVFQSIARLRQDGQQKFRNAAGQYDKQSAGEGEFAWTI